PLKLVQGPACSGFPNPDGVVVAFDGHELAVGGQGEAEHRIAASSDYPDLFAALQVPGADIPGVTGNQPGATGSRKNMQDVCLVPRQTTHLLSGGYLPQADGLVCAARGERLAIDREGQIVDSLPRLSRERSDILARCRLPQPDGAVAPDGGQDLPVGGE